MILVAQICRPFPAKVTRQTRSSESGAVKWNAFAAFSLDMNSRRPRQFNHRYHEPAAGFCCRVLVRGYRSQRLANSGNMEWDAIKTGLAFWGAVTGTAGLFLQYWRHRSETARFKMAAEMSIRFEPGSGKKLWLRTTITNVGQRKGFVRLFQARLNQQMPYNIVRFVSDNQTPVAIDGGDEKSFEVPLPVEFIAALEERGTMTLNDTSGNSSVADFRTIDKEAIRDGQFSGVYFAPLPPGVSEPQERVLDFRPPKQ